MGTLWRTSNFRFLGVHLDDDLTWSTNTTAAIKDTSETVLSESTYTETVGVLLPLRHREHPHILHLCVVFQLHSRREEVKPRSLSDVPSPPWKTGTVPTVSGRPTIFSETHLPPGHTHFELLPSGRRYRSMKTQTNRLKTVSTPEP